MTANGILVRDRAGWGAGLARVALEMMTYDSLPPVVRAAVASANGPMLSGVVLDEWRAAERRGITAAEFARWIG